MKRTAVIATILYFLLCSHTLFEVSLGDSNCYDEGFSVVPLNNGYLLSTAHNCSGNARDWQSTLFLLNDEGDTTWSKTNPGVNGIIKETPDSQLVFAGGNQAGFVYDTIKVFKTTLSGDIIWERSFFHPVCKNLATDILPTKTGYLLTGIFSNNSCSNPVYDSFIIKLDEHGNKVWEYLVTGPNNDQIHAVRQLRDGNIVALGWTNSKTSGNDADYLLVKLDKNGHLIWSKTYGDETNNFGYGMEITDQGDIIVTGYSHLIEAKKIDQSGNIIWEQTYGPACGGRYFKVKQTSDGGLTFLGNEQYQSECRSVLFKTNGQGELLWKKSFRATLREFKENPDGSFILTGYRSYLPEAYVVKFDSTRLPAPLTLSEAEDATIKLLDSLGISTSVDETLLEEKYPAPKIYPNPAQVEVNIAFHNPDNSSYRLDLFDMNGRLVQSIDNITDEIITIKKRNLSKGTYTYRLTGEGNLYYGTFLFN